MLQNNEKTTFHQSHACTLLFKAVHVFRFLSNFSLRLYINIKVMNNTKYITFLTLTLIFQYFMAFIPAQAQEPEKIHEKVQVINVEVPVRVYYKKNPVKGLGKKDFQLFINEVERKIHGFYEVRKKIEPHPASQESRLFVLIFNVSSYNLDVEQGLHTLFEKVIRSNDRLMVLTNNFFLKEKFVENPQKMKGKIIKILNIESTKIKQELESIELNLRYLASSFKLDLKSAKEMREPDPERIKAIMRRFVQDYINIFNEFKIKFFSPDETQYLRIAQYLNQKKIKKWVLNFYQIPVFPQLDQLNGNIYKEIDDFFRGSGEGETNPYISDFQLRVRDESTVQNISKIFLNTGATFHTLLMKPKIVKFFEEYNYKPFVIDSESVTLKTTKKTGGCIVASNNIQKFIKKISDKEDVYYMLTYTPEEGEDETKIKIMVSNKKYQVVYDNQQRSQYLKQIIKKIKTEAPQIRFQKIELKDRLIHTLISGIQLESVKDEKKQGKILLNIKILNDQAQEISGIKKAFICKADKIPIRLRLPALKKGNYQMILEVNDIHTGKNDLELKDIKNTTDYTLEPGQKPFQFITGPVSSPPRATVSDRRNEMYQFFEEVAPGSALMKELKERVSTSLSKKEIDPGILPQILKKVADYCLRLETISLNFFCNEEINEVVLKALEWRGKSRKEINKLTYGYQLIKDKGKTVEKRVLFKQNGEEKVKKNASLKTHFKYKYIIYAPLILNKESQQYYRYEIIGKRSWKGKNVYIIEAVPRSTNTHKLVSGKFWVDEKDFSILRIEVYQSSIKNYGEIVMLASQHKLEPQITIINEYEIVKRGVRFPSKLYYEEAYKNKKGKMVVQSLGNITFKDYIFYTIDTKVTKEEQDVKKRD